MKIQPSQLAPHWRKIVKDIGSEAARQNCAAYLVGGIVRDLLLKRKDWDLDIVLECDAIEFAKKFATGQQIRMVPYPEFRTVTLEYLDHTRVDLVTARKEIYPQSGALPVVTPGSLQEDLFRRDFTINAMAMSIDPSHFGEIIDPYSGQKDLREKRIRVLHDQSFMDDPTRLIRAVRFEQRFGFKIEPHTLKLFRTALAKNVVDNVKSPRYFEEFSRIFLKEPSPFRNLKRLSELGGLSFFKFKRHPDLLLVQRLEKIWPSLLKNKICQPQDRELVFLAGLFSQLSEQEIVKAAACFHWTRLQKESLILTAQRQRLAKVLSRPRLRRSEVYEILKSVDVAAIALLWAAAASTTKKKIQQFWTYDRHVNLKINGNDLQRLGLPPGERLGEIQRLLLQKKIDQGWSSRAQEWKEAKRLLAGK